MKIKEDNVYFANLNKDDPSQLIPILVIKGANDKYLILPIIIKDSPLFSQPNNSNSQHRKRSNPYKSNKTIKKNLEENKNLVLIKELKEEGKDQFLYVNVEDAL